MFVARLADPNIFGVVKAFGESTSAIHLLPLGDVLRLLDAVGCPNPGAMVAKAVSVRTAERLPVVKVTRNGCSIGFIQKSVFLAQATKFIDNDGMTYGDLLNPIPEDN